MSQRRANIKTGGPEKNLESQKTALRRAGSPVSDRQAIGPGPSDSTPSTDRLPGLRGDQKQKHLRYPVVFCGWMAFKKMVGRGSLAGLLLGRLVGWWLVVALFPFMNAKRGTEVHPDHPLTIGGFWKTKPIILKWPRTNTLPDFHWKKGSA